MLASSLSPREGFGFQMGCFKIVVLSSSALACRGNPAAGGESERSKYVYRISNNSRTTSKSYSYLLIDCHNLTRKSTVLVFVLCWSPYIVFDLLQVYGYIPRTQSNIAVATLIQSLAPLNSAANPIIYCMFSTSKPTR